MNKILPLCLTVLSLFVSPVWAAQLNGFELKSQTLESHFVLKIGEQGGGQKVADAADHKAAAESPWQENQLILGIVIDSQAHAYSLTSLLEQSMVNDTVGGIPVLVLFCNLCGTGTVYDRGANGKDLTFGNSGLLYRSDELFYDAQTLSLWSPFLHAAVTGPSEGQKLPIVPSQVTYWGKWKKEHPNTTASVPSGAGSDSSEVTTLKTEERIAAMAAVRHGYHPKTPTLGLSWPDGDALAFTASEVLEAGGQVSETIEGAKVSISFDSDSQTFHLDSALQLEVFRGSWVDWKTKFPQGRWYTASQAKH